ncbi:hypothetical protein RJ640_015707 [Escallonia rubra]|uniref:G protein gamma domain-containing protein n=1 Tax=Escallonia rubra TaxID=112253 RepID=A0AA88R4P6_9ASTE|nr:hypothetical protein RJ640_015707 [Escallonia rubra]
MDPILSDGGGADEQRSQEEAATSQLARAGPSNFVGKHRMAAAIARLHQEIQIIQEELDQLETLGAASIVCTELVSSIESIPDPLLPETNGPAEVGWDRWFQGANGARNRKRWI